MTQISNECSYVPTEYIEHVQSDASCSIQFKRLLIVICNKNHRL